MQRQKSIAGLVLIGMVAGGGVWWTSRNTAAPPKRVYNPEGYGGVSLEAPQPPAAKANPKSGAAKADPVAPALDAYNKGDYAAAESAARKLLEGSTSGVAAKDGDPKRPAVHQPSPEKARARWVVAFSAARKKDLGRAREEFARLKKEAADENWTLEEARELTSLELSEAAGGQQPGMVERPVSPTGEMLPTLEEEGAYQHAVLTGALGDRAAAEAEFKVFMRQYPESPLVHAAIKRIGRYHGGDIPKEAEAVWKQAVETAQDRLKNRTRARSLCAPAVLAEVLRRAGLAEAEEAGGPAVPPGPRVPAPGLTSTDPLVQKLSTEMKTSEMGTTLAELVRSAKKRGFKAGAYRLTWRGLLQQMPAPSKTGSRYVIALLDPGHVVLVESAAAGNVRYWDSDGAGPQQAAVKVLPMEGWQGKWKGIVIRLDR